MQRRLKLYVIGAWIKIRTKRFLTVEKRYILGHGDIYRPQSASAEQASQKDTERYCCESVYGHYVPKDKKLKFDFANITY
jgi:hypothetical protein